MISMIICVLLTIFAFAYQVYDMAFVFLFATLVSLYILPATIGMNKQKEKAQGETLSPLKLLGIPLGILEGGVKLIIGAFDAIFGGEAKDKRKGD